MTRKREFQNVTIMDVAQEAGVSYSTVSRVVNNKGVVKEETRIKVESAMTRLGYVVNQQARSLAGGASQVVGLLVRNLGSAYMGEIVRGIDNVLARSEYDLMLYTAHRHRSNETAYVKMLTQGMVDGLILILPRHPEAYLQVLRERNFPYVLVDHQGVAKDEPAVGVTNWQGAYDATSYLLDLGHRRIGFITGAMYLGSARARLAGFQAALKDYGIAFDNRLLYQGDFFRSKGYAGASVLLNCESPPTAIFASNDVMALGVMEAVRERGLHIPDDISIVGFDDVPQAAVVHPALTSVRQPLVEMGALATQMLLDFIKNPQRSPHRLDLPTTLVKRQSCTVPRQGDF